MVKIAVDCKRGQIGLVSLVVYIVVINGICTRSSLFHPVRAFQVPGTGWNKLQQPGTSWKKLEEA